jgi:hypothetical protein
MSAADKEPSSRDFHLQAVLHEYLQAVDAGRPTVRSY